MEPRKLYRSRINNVIGGVAGGIAEYFNTDPLVIRILFVVLTLIGGGGVIIYLIMWIFVPENPDHLYQKLKFQNMEDTKNETRQPDNKFDFDKDKWKQRNQGNLIGGLVLITLGALFLIDRFVPRVNFGDLWPVLLVIAGIALLINSFPKQKQDKNEL